MLKQRIHKRFQFLHQQTVAGTAILRYGEVIRQLNDMQVAVSFPLMFHLHHPDRIRYRTTVHRGHTLSLFLCCVQFIKIWEQHILFFLKMHFQVLQRFTDQCSQFMQFRMRFPMYSFHLLQQRQQFRSTGTNTPMMYLQNVIHQQVQRPRSKRNPSVTSFILTEQCLFHFFYSQSQICTGLFQRHFAMTAEINAIFLEHTCRCKIIGHNLSHTRMLPVYCLHI